MSGSTGLTILYRQQDPVEVAGARVRHGDLWLPLERLRETTGWELKPHGLCAGEMCVPVPKGREHEWATDDCFNLSAFARHLDQPVVHDDKANVWAFGDGGPSAGTGLSSAEAPDFALPDLDGTMHRLSGYRGQKVLLLAWASW
jgi:hypothetical protein